MNGIYWWLNPLFLLCTWIALYVRGSQIKNWRVSDQDMGDPWQKFWAEVRPCWPLTVDGFFAWDGSAPLLAVLGSWLLALLGPGLPCRSWWVVVFAQHSVLSLWGFIAQQGLHSRPKLLSWKIIMDEELCHKFLTIPIRDGLWEWEYSTNNWGALLGGLK